MRLAKKYDKNQQGNIARVGKEHVAVYLDFSRNGIAMHVLSREIGSDEPQITWTGEEIRERPEATEITPFLFISNNVIDQFPNILEALSEALQEFLND